MITIIKNEKKNIKLEKSPAVRIDHQGRFVLNKALKALLEIESEQDGCQFAIIDSKIGICYSKGEGSFHGSFKVKECSWRFTSKPLIERLILESFLCEENELKYPIVLIADSDRFHVHEGNKFFLFNLKSN